MPFGTLECGIRKGTNMRLNFEFSEDRIKELKNLQNEAHLETMKDLFNNALTIFEWAVEETKKGNEIAAVNEQTETYRVLVMPVLQQLTRETARYEQPARRAV
jgi:hypothetical protein